MPKSEPPNPAEFRQQLIELVSTGKTPAQLAQLTVVLPLIAHAV